MNEQLHAVMLNALIKGGIGELAQAAYDYLKLPIMISDAEYKCLAHFPDKSLGDPLWDAIVEHGIPPLCYIQMFNAENMMQMGVGQKEPYFLDWGFLTDHPRILGNIFVNDTIVGYIAIPCPSCTKEVLETVGIICKVVAIEFQRNQMSAGNIPDSWTMFLTNLLEGKIGDREQLKQWLLHLDKEVRGDFCIMAAQPDCAVSDKMLLPFVQKNIERVDPGFHPVISGKNIYFLIFNQTSNESCHKTAELIIKKLFSMGLCFGISNRFSDLHQAEIYCGQAAFALTVCQETADRRSLYYNDCAIRQLFKTVIANIPVQSCIHPALDGLKEYDRKNGTDYLKTLSTYILSMCNAMETVKELHIHRNTLPYRLDAIERIADINLSHRETCAYLFCSFYIQKFFE